MKKVNKFILMAWGIPAVFVFYCIWLFRDNFAAICVCFALFVAEIYGMLKRWE